MSPQAGKMIMIIGGLIILAGAVVFLFGDKLNFLGNLPGDVKIERENTKVYFPIATMILLSLIFSVVFNIIKKLF